MKNTVIMLAVIATMLLTWMLLASIGWAFGETIKFKESATHEATVIIMLIFGWIPSVIVGRDVYEKLEGQ